MFPTKQGFYSVINPPVTSGDVQSDEYNVDLTGYLPFEQQIQQMMYAGHKLDISRTLDRYEFEGVDMMEVDTSELLPDRTRFGNYDLADFTRDQLYMRQVAQKARRAAEDAQKAAEAAQATSTDKMTSSSSETPSEAPEA